MVDYTDSAGWVPHYTARLCHFRGAVTSACVMKNSKPLYHGHRFPGAVISCAVRWYFLFQLSLRDIEELLFERGCCCEL